MCASIQCIILSTRVGQQELYIKLRLLLFIISYCTRCALWFAHNPFTIAVSLLLLLHLVLIFLIVLPAYTKARQLLGHTIERRRACFRIFGRLSDGLRGSYSFSISAKTASES